MLSYKSFFDQKKVLFVGLGVDCEMVPDIISLIKMGVQVTVFDLRSEVRIKSAIEKIQAAGMAHFEFGTFPADLVKTHHLVIKSEDISDDIACIKEAVHHGISVELVHTLLLKIAPSITLIGVLGMSGKSTTAYLINKILANKDFHFIDQNPLSFLKKIKKGDTVLVTIPDNHYPAYIKARISPYVAVVTNETSIKVLDHQTYNNFLIANDSTIDILKKENHVKAKILRTSPGIIPSSWNIPFPNHIKENMALALRVAELFKVEFDDVQEIYENFKPLKGRLELCKKFSGIDFYNDAAAVCPYATFTSLKTIGTDTVLILGGMEHNYDKYELFEAIPKFVSIIILIPGSGTMKIHNIFPNTKYAESIEEAVVLSRQYANKGGKVLFSPGFLPFTSISDQTDRFQKAVKKL